MIENLMIILFLFMYFIITFGIVIGFYFIISFILSMPKLITKKLLINKTKRKLSHE